VSEQAAIITAFCAGIGTVLTAWAGVIKVRGDTQAKGEQQCEERLRNARTEAERMADTLHAWRMQHPGEVAPEVTPGEATT